MEAVFSVFETKFLRTQQEFLDIINTEALSRDYIETDRSGDLKKGSIFYNIRNAKSLQPLRIYYVLSSDISCVSLYYNTKEILRVDFNLEDIKGPIERLFKVFDEKKEIQSQPLPELIMDIKTTTTSELFRSELFLMEIEKNKGLIKQRDEKIKAQDEKIKEFQEKKNFYKKLFLEEIKKKEKRKLKKRNQEKEQLKRAKETAAAKVSNINSLRNRFINPNQNDPIK